MTKGAAPGCENLLGFPVSRVMTTLRRFGAAAGGLLLAAAAAAAPPAKMNVVVLDVCSARADHFGLYGYSRDTTPRLDELAKESAVFDQTIAQSSWCLPNYASLLTGHVPEVHGLYANLPLRKLPRGERTLAERMRKAGYRTGAFSGGIYLLPAWGLNRGFETYVNYFSTSEAVPATFASYLPRVERWIDRPAKKPFFLYLSVDDLHAPYQSDEPERYDPGYAGVADDTATLNVRFFRAYDGEPLPEGDPLAGRLAAFRASPKNLFHLTARYDASLRQVDRDIDRFIQGLKARGLWDKTLVVVTADHGELLGEHGLLGHTQGLYEPIVHVPLLIHDPARPATRGARLGQLVERIDLTPTILHEAGAAADLASLQGRSLVPLLNGEGAAWRTVAFAASKRNRPQADGPEIDERIARGDRWKLHWYLYKDRYELYDLASDPGEERDVSVEHPEIVARLSFELIKNLERTRPHAPGSADAASSEATSSAVLAPIQDPR